MYTGKDIEEYLTGAGQTGISGFHMHNAQDNNDKTLSRAAIRLQILIAINRAIKIFNRD